MPASGPLPFTVGGSNGFSAEVSASLSSAEGSFDSVSGVTSEEGIEHGTGSPVPDTYALQLNTNRFTTPACSSAANPAVCQGWQQFVYSSSNQRLFIQYWLIRYNTTCPTNWFPRTPAGTTEIYCYRNGPNAAVVPGQPITSLGTLHLSGAANAAGNDTVTMFGSANGAAVNQGSMLSLGGKWKIAEFIVAGDCCRSQAIFNANSTLVTRTTVHYGSREKPTCRHIGFTAETNNLNLVGTTPIGTGPAPAIVTTESNAPGTSESCESAKGFGDTHLTTFSGLLYDFQAAGEFILAETGPGFAVQARQRSGAPRWPNASVNTAVGARIGKTKVSICLPDRLEIDGEPTEVKEGSPRVLPGGGDISRFGNVYLVRGQDGNSMRAQVNDGWIDVTVGLGRWPTRVHGLLANSGGAVNQLQTRDGQVLTEPLSFKELYYLYGDSWRVKEGESVLCGEKVKAENPERPFDANDLKPALAKRARAICTEAGVKKNEDLLEACTLDVAVIGDPAAAKAYVGAPLPAAVGAPP